MFTSRDGRNVVMTAVVSNAGLFAICPNDIDKVLKLDGKGNVIADEEYQN